jgi:hypothetical protein
MEIHKGAIFDRLKIKSSSLFPDGRGTTGDGAVITVINPKLPRRTCVTQSPGLRGKLMT